MTRPTRSTTARGYGAKHQKERARWDPVVKAGGAVCSRCGQPIAPDEPWELDHTDDRQTYLGPAHAACNRVAGGRKGAVVTNAQRAMTVRDW